VASVASPSPLLPTQVVGSGSGGWRGGWRRMAASGDWIWLEAAGGGCRRAWWRLWEGWQSAWEAGVAEAVTVASAAPPTSSQW
jgi:hypothetical protein